MHLLCTCVRFAFLLLKSRTPVAVLMVLEVQLPLESARWCKCMSRSGPPQERAVVHLHKPAVSWLCRVFLLDLLHQVSNSYKNQFKKQDYNNESLCNTA